MNAIKHYIQYAVSGESSGHVSFIHLLPTFLPIVGLPFLFVMFVFFRGNYKLFGVGFGCYLLVTTLLPIAAYEYSAQFLGVSAFWAITAQIILFSCCTAVLSLFIKRYFYKTDEEYFLAKNFNVDYRDKGIVLFPHYYAAVFIAWYIVSFTIGFVFSVLFWFVVPSIPHKMSASLMVAAFFGYGIVPYFGFLRMLGRCPYCQLGVFDMRDADRECEKEKDNRALLTCITFRQVVFFAPISLS